MAGQGDGPGNRFDDLFDDLDKFFAPIEQVDRPLREPGGAAPVVAEPHTPRSEPQIILPDPEPAVGPEPAEDPGPDLGEPAREAEGDDLRAAWGPGDEHVEVAVAPPSGSSEGADWTRLRDVLGDDERDETFEFTAGSADVPETEDAAYGYEGADLGGAGEEPREISIEDLKKPPPQYRDLPGATPPEEEEGHAAPAASSSPEGPTEQWPTEPHIGDVEAVADHLAQEFGESSYGTTGFEDDEPSKGRADVGEDLLPEVSEPLGPRTVKVGEPEALMGGPTWEEPTGSHPILGEPAPAAHGRSLPMATLTAVILVVAAIITLAVAKAAFAVVAGIIVLLAQAELYATMHRRGYQPATAMGLVLGGLVLAGAYLKGEAGMLLFVAMSLMLSFLWYMAGAPKTREGAVANIGSTLLGVVYVPFLAGYVLILLSQPNQGRPLMLVVLGLTFLYDVVAYGVGSLWGSRPLAPTISPKKSWEGLIGATIVTFIAAFVVPSVVDYLSVANAVGLAIVVSIFAPLGDLAESTIKRDLSVKDMGSILPGHGGALDRIDSVLFVAPAAFYFLRLIL